MTPNQSYIYLMKVDGICNNNKYYSMTCLGNGMFEAVYGREGAEKPAKKQYPMSKWDEKYNEKLSSRKGYTDVTKFKSEIKTDTTAKNSKGQIVSTDAEVVSLITMLQSYANIATTASYKVEAKQVTQAQVDEAQLQIDNLSTSLKRYWGKSEWSIERFNKALTYLMVIIPRKMKLVADHLISSTTTKKDIEELIGNEQSLLDSMAGQVLTNTATANSDISKDANKDGQVTLLESLGLEIRVATKVEFENAKRFSQNHGHRIKRVFKVVNKTTQKAFDDDMKKAVNKKTELFFHGSRNANWFSIINQGLKIRPSNAVTTGSLLGDSIYFADDVDKSLGYTDSGRHVNGKAGNSVYAALYDVRVGNQFEMKYNTKAIYNAKQELFEKGFDSVYAHRGADTGWSKLRKSEFTIYNHSQCTIKYLIEFSV